MLSAKFLRGIRSAARPLGPLIAPPSLSGYINEALRRQLQRDRLLAFLEAADRRVGPVTAEVMEEVRRSWPERAARRKQSA